MTGEIAQFIKCPPCKLRSLSPRTHVKSQVCGNRLLIPVLGRESKEDPSEEKEEILLAYVII